MTLRLSAQGEVALVGDCSSADAEDLLRHLCAHPEAEIDWRRCQSAHTALVQVLIAATARPIGPPAGEFLARFIAPLLNQDEHRKNGVEGRE
ncbi:MAG TPA: hypothetical protein VG166_11370 [Caulobacteraceae bacterium]|jgi:hypothetical protein|nr:hypothetical protein [Caulobacteraceae bacterium]